MQLGSSRCLLGRVAQMIDFHNITRHLMFRCPSESQSFAMFDHLVTHVWLKRNRADIRRSATSISYQP